MVHRLIDTIPRTKTKTLPLRMVIIKESVIFSCKIKMLFIKFFSQKGLKNQTDGHLGRHL